MIDSTKTFLKAAKALLENGATKVGFLFPFSLFFLLLLSPFRNVNTTLIASGLHHCDPLDAGKGRIRSLGRVRVYP